jgi:hypothetical protein
MKLTPLKLPIYKIICLAIKHHSHSLAAQITILQSLQYHEHLAEPMAELLAILGGGYLGLRIRGVLGRFRGFWLGLVSLIATPILTAFLLLLRTGALDGSFLAGLAGDDSDETKKYIYIYQLEIKQIHDTKCVQPTW